MKKSLLIALILSLARIVFAEEARTGGAREEEGIWHEDEVGKGFQRGAQYLGLSFGIGLGTRGGERSHDIVLGTLRYGALISEMLGEGKFYGGNFEFGAEVFGGTQFRSDWAYIVGGAPMVRYNVATGTRWVPFLEAGFGVTNTDIKGEDLSTTLQFKSETGVGTHYFLSRNKAITAQYHFFHLSNGGVEKPNGGVNINLFSLGVSVFF